jgi:uncharacterized protein
MLAALATANGERFTPVQVQKLFFLIDREVARLIDGPHFNFQPYHYGRFDKAVYQELEALSRDGLVDVHVRPYALTLAGQEAGLVHLNALHPDAKDYIERVSTFVRSLSFSALVSAIYKAYPEMRANSVFQG